MGLALGMNLKFYTSVAKRLKLKVWKFWALVPTFLEVTGEKLLGGSFAPPPILNWVKGEDNVGTLYEKELQKSNDKEFRVEKVVK